VPRFDFATFVLDQLAEETDYLKPVVFMDEATFHTNSVVHRHNFCIWGTENPREIIQHVRDSVKINAWCGLLHKKKLSDPFFSLRPLLMLLPAPTCLRPTPSCSQRKELKFFNMTVLLPIMATMSMTHLTQRSLVGGLDWTPVTRCPIFNRIVPFLSELSRQI
jgi:hypothetical protein